MEFRRANVRRGRLRELAAVECDLGPVIGEALLPMRPVYLHRAVARCWVQQSTHALLAVLGAGSLVLLVIVYLAMLLAYYPASPFK